MTEGQYTFGAIGTIWHIDLPGIENATAEKIITEVRARIEDFEQTYSRFRPDSLIGQISKKAGSYSFPEDIAPMMDLYRKLYDITDGKVTPLIGKVLVDAGYNPEYTLKPKDTILPAKKWNNVMKYEHPRLITSEPIQLDFGALGKGYLIDIVGDILESSGIKAYTINAGGDIRQRSIKEKLKVGLENPEDATQAIGTADIQNVSICGSSGNRRNWGKFHHIIDPDKVASPIHIKALWVTASTTLVADALATALFFTKPEVLQKEFDFEYAIQQSDGSVFHSRNFPGTFFE
jgi:thiamine biosynthesis lipoprotein